MENEDSDYIDSKLIKEYENLNEKCDIIIDKIKKRKKRKAKSAKKK